MFSFATWKVENPPSHWAMGSEAPTKAPSWMSLTAISTVMSILIIVPHVAICWRNCYIESSSALLSSILIFIIIVTNVNDHMNLHYRTRTAEGRNLGPWSSEGVVGVFPANVSPAKSGYMKKQLIACVLCQVWVDCKCCWNKGGKELKVSSSINIYIFIYIYIIWHTYPLPFYEYSGLLPSPSPTSRSHSPSIPTAARRPHTAKLRPKRAQDSVGRALFCR